MYVVLDNSSHINQHLEMRRETVNTFDEIRFIFAAGYNYVRLHK